MKKLVRRNTKSARVVERALHMGAGSIVEVTEDGDGLRLQIVRPAEKTELKGLAGLVKPPARGFPRRLEEFAPASLVARTGRAHP